MLKKYKAIIFDLDGTLINSLPYHYLAFKDLLEEHNIHINDKHLKVLMGKSTHDIFTELKKKYGFKEKIEDLREERRYHYFKFVGQKNLLFPGVEPLLKKLRKKYKLGLATGSSRIIFSHSTNKSFETLFDTIVTITDVKNGKPDPEQFLKTARKLKVKPEQCLVIGDSLYDADGAANAKMDCIGVTTGYTRAKTFREHKTVKVIVAVTDLSRVLKA
jgi:HAD superfamily hydrolase (TIGR01509 family)